MKEIIHWLNDSSYTKPLSPACNMCANGSKMVVLITGLCPSTCFYCPLSKRKIGKDLIFADEWKLENEDDTEKLIKEAELIKATGAGITGGDPLFVWKRTKKYISLLKNHFGSKFHIHLYTSGLKNTDNIDDLVSAGLDEIRFHPLPTLWENMEKGNLKNISRNDVDVAIEIPAMPRMEKEILSLIKWADQHNLKWINLNELEFSETNAEELKKRGFTVKDDISSAVKGSQETAIKLIEFSKDLEIGVHYCSSSFKDGIQLRNRIKRRAKSVAKGHEIITKEGTILNGIVLTSDKTLTQLNSILMDKFEIDEKHIFLNKDKNRIELPLFILEKIALNLKKQNIQSYLIEEYPTADALEVEKIPLPL